MKGLPHPIEKNVLNAASPPLILMVHSFLLLSTFEANNWINIMDLFNRVGP